MARKKLKAPAKKPTPKTSSQAKGKPAPAAAPPPPTIVVFYELRGVTGVRHHSEHADPARAQIAARHLISSPDVDQAWIIKGVEVLRASS
jgi:hypothetical protein